MSGESGEAPLLSLGYTVSEKEYLDACRVLRRPRRKFRNRVIAAIFLLLVVGALSTNHIFATGFLFGTVCFFALGLVALRGQLREGYQARYEHFQIALVITGKAWKSTNPQMQNEVEWSYFTEWRETDSVFVLVRHNVQCHVVPKRAFASAEQLAWFRGFLTTHITAKAGQPTGAKPPPLR